jgi:acetoin utilization deacetylase AcuC-like enzyme
VEIIYVTDPAFYRHDTGAWHPERPARLEAVERGVMTCGLTVSRLAARPAERAELELVHRPEYIDAIARFCRSGGGSLDPDTVAVEASWDAALLAAGSGPAALTALEDRPDATAFLAVRPPGHHATSNRAMGFCLFNNIAVTAATLRTRGNKVAIVDWDVHHGNGTQDMFESDPNVLYLSLHQYPFYPGGGALVEVGVGAGAGTVVNIPLPAGTGGDVYRSAFERIVSPVLTQFAPDWILVSSGFDAHEEDPLAEQRLVASDYSFMAGALTAVVPANRIVTFLEGGYHLPAITSSVAAALRGFAGIGQTGEWRRSAHASWSALEEAAARAAEHWKTV